MPDVYPVAEPVVALIVATDVLLLFHVPPVERSLKIPEEPAHIAVLPVIGSIGLTNTGIVTKQPEVSEYVIVALPPEMPVTIPVKEPIVAIALLLLLQLPPAVVSLSAITELSHTVSGPDIAAGTEHGGIFAVALFKNPDTNSTHTTRKEHRFMVLVLISKFTDLEVLCIYYVSIYLQILSGSNFFEYMIVLP